MTRLVSAHPLSYALIHQARDTTDELSVAALAWAPDGPIAAERTPGSTGACWSGGLERPETASASDQKWITSLLSPSRTDDERSRPTPLNWRD